MKKKVLSVIANFLLITICLSGCGESSGGNDLNTNTNNSINRNSSSETHNLISDIISSTEQQINNNSTVEVTIGSFLFEDMTETEIKENAKESGFISCTINEDGSVTYTMTESTRNEKLKEYKEKADETIQGFLNGSDRVESFTKIDYNDNLSCFNIYVDKQKYTMWDNLYVYSFYFIGAFYQNFAGFSSDDIDVLINFIDKDTKDVFETASYREFMKNSDNNDDSSHSNDNIGDSKVLSLNEKILKTDVCEFYVEYTKISDDVLPPSPKSVYSHYKADEGRKYVDICISYKNLSSKKIDADKIMTASLNFAGKYQYSGFSMIEEDNRGDFTYSSITSVSPLSTEYIHYLFEITDEMAESTGELVISFTIGSEKYAVIVREGDNGDVITPNSKSVYKTSGSLKKGELIVIPNVCEFNIDYDEITDDVLPLKPASVYSHYKADDGKVYVNICFSYKNWKTKSVEADEVISAKLKYSDKYEYSGFSMIEDDNRGDFTYSNITSIKPLFTEYIHYLFEVPNEIENETESIIITFTVGKNTYSYTIR